MCSCIFSLPLPVPRLYNLLFPDFIGHVDILPRDVFSDLERDPARFFRMCGETPDFLMELTAHLHPFITNQGPGQRHRHSPRNRILMTLIWLRQYPTYNVLATLFNLSPAAITRHIYVIVPLLWSTRSGLHLEISGQCFKMQSVQSMVPSMNFRDH